MIDEPNGQPEAMDRSRSQVINCLRQRFESLPEHAQEHLMRCLRPGTPHRLTDEEEQKLVYIYLNLLDLRSD
jgi:hypothetical protein